MLVLTNFKRIPCMLQTLFRRMLSIRSKKTIIVFCILLVFLLIICYKHKELDKSTQWEKRIISCYGYKDSFLTEMADNFTLSGRKLFFLETSCKGFLNLRQACSVESAARMNPNWTVLVIFAGPLNLDDHKNMPILTTLSSIRNVKFLRINVTSFVKKTPLERFFAKDYMLKRSWIPVVHSSDLLRLLILNKYGGVYLDLDVIVKKSFDDLPGNFVAKQNKKEISSGVLAFTKDGIGKLFTSTALKLISQKFNPGGWEENGPYLILECLVKICNYRIYDNINVNNTVCDGIRIFDSKYFFPIHYLYYEFYFWPEILAVDDSEAYTHHIWNHLLDGKNIHKNSLFSRLAKKYCPTIFGFHQSNNSFTFS